MVYKLAMSGSFRPFVCYGIILVNSNVKTVVQCSGTINYLVKLKYCVLYHFINLLQNYLNSFAI